MAKQTESTELRAKRRDRERDKIKAQSSRRRKPGCLYGPIFVVVSLQAKRKHASGGVWHRPRHFEDRMDTNCTAPSPIPLTFAKKTTFLLRKLHSEIRWLNLHYTPSIVYCVDKLILSLCVAHSHMC